MNSTQPPRKHSAPLRPNLDTVTTIQKDGSRLKLHPADVQGRFTLARRLVAFFLILIYILLPWIPVNGHPAIFLDVLHRRFHLFGYTLAAQNLWIAFFLITGTAFSLYAVSAVLGRIWCGWACPYTVFLEHVYRRIERWIDGDAVERKRLDAAPWTPQKILKRTLKHGIYLITSVFIAHVFLSYFFSLPKLWGMITLDPRQHWGAFCIMLFLTGGLYFAFAWFREQFCIMLCPYGRLQSALTDNHTMVIGYDAKRGEPRGHKQSATQSKSGDCIDCFQCVRVCPTGIDIRQGLQMECIGCAACVDACNSVMTKIHRPQGLIRYDSLEGLEGGKTKWFRTRTYVYGLLILIGATVMLISLNQVKPVHIRALRLAGASFYQDTDNIRNQFQVRFSSASHQDETFTVTLQQLPEGSSLTGLDSDQTLNIPAMSEEVRTLIIQVPVSAYKGEQRFQMHFSGKEHSASDTTLTLTLLGPNLWDLKKPESPASTQP